MAKNSKYINITMPSIEEDREINAAANTDPDALPMSGAQLKAKLRYQKVRYIGLTLFMIALCFLAGFMMLYMGLKIWEVGEIKRRSGYLLRPSTDPIMFWFSVGLALFSGAALLVGALMSIQRIFASARERQKLIAQHPAVYGGVRLSIKLIGAALIGLFILAVLSR